MQRNAKNQEDGSCASSIMSLLSLATFISPSRGSQGRYQDVLKCMFPENGLTRSLHFFWANGKSMEFADWRYSLKNFRIIFHLPIDLIFHKVQHYWRAGGLVCTTAAGPHLYAFCGVCVEGVASLGAALLIYCKYTHLDYYALIGGLLV